MSPFLSLCDNHAAAQYVTIHRWFHQLWESQCELVMHFIAKLSIIEAPYERYFNVWAYMIYYIVRETLYCLSLRVYSSYWVKIIHAAPVQKQQNVCCQ